jgi:glycosyltransferase involved in cell wall biosynthesis
MRVAEPLYDDVDRAVREFDPDVLFLHWAGYAERQFPTLERLGIPFGVRLHGFDLDGELVARLQAHPLCIGVWTYPSAGFDAIGDHALSTTFDPSALPAAAAKRDLVLSVSAGLPKKDFPLLVSAFAAIRGGERRIALGTTKGFNHVPGDVTGLCEEHADPPLVQVNLERAQVFDLLARTAVLVYTLLPEIQFGMPMSVVEALCAGCSVVVPDRPECVSYAGPGARTYRTEADIVRHCEEALAGGPAVEAERARNLAYGRERFGDPEIGRRFHAELTAALARLAP